MAITAEQHRAKLLGLEGELKALASASSTGTMSAYRKADYDARIGRRVSSLQNELKEAGRLGTQLSEEETKRLGGYSTEYIDQLRSESAKQAVNKEKIDAENAATAGPSNITAGTIGGQRAKKERPTMPRGLKAQPETAGPEGALAGTLAPQAAPPPRQARPYKSIIDRSAPVLREADKESATLQRMLEERGAKSIDDLTAAQRTLVREAVNMDVYGQAAPLFKTGGDVLSIAQKAQERAVLAAASGAAQVESIVEETTRTPTSTITSDDARDMTEEEKTNVSSLQGASDESAESGINGLLSTDTDILAATQAGEDITALLEEKRRFYEDTYTRAVEQIKQVFDGKEADYREQAESRMAGTISTLARMGIFGTSTAAVQYVNDEARTNDAKLLAFAAEEAAALQKAYEAYTEADFDVAESMLKIASDTRAEIAGIKQTQLENRVKTAQLAKLESDDAATTLQNLVDAGLSETDLPPDYLQYLDAKQDMPYGTSALLLQAGTREKARQDQIDNLEQLDTVMNVTSKLSPEQYVELNGSRYYGTRSDYQFQGTEIDKATGDVISVFYNERTKEVTTNRQRGVLTPNVGYTQQWVENGDGSKSLWYVPDDPSQGSPVPASSASSGGASGVNNLAMQEFYPEGLSYSDVADQGAEQSDFWCLRFMGTLDARGQDFINSVGDTIDEKAAAADETIGFGSGQNAPRVGDYVMTNEDSQYGHIALINDIRTDPTTGERVAVLTESNGPKYNNGNNGGPLTVSYSRTIKLSPDNMAQGGGRIMGFMHSQLRTDFTSQSSTGITSYSVDDETPVSVIDLREKFNKEAKPLIDVRDAYGRVVASASDPSAAGDMALIFNFMKILDPGSTVREGEYATAQNAGSVEERIRAQYNSAIDGTKLADDVRGDFLDRAGRLYDVQVKSYKSTTDFYKKQAESRGYDAYDVIGGLGDTREIRVREKSTGKTGTIPSDEFDANLYDRV